MDGPIWLEQRKLAIEFDSDRYGADRVELAYRRTQTLVTLDSPRKSGVQTALPVPPATATLDSEIQG
jgi:hypothetical protein